MMFITSGYFDDMIFMNRVWKFHLLWLLLLTVSKNTFTLYKIEYDYEKKSMEPRFYRKSKESRDKDQTGKTDTHNKKHEITNGK